MIPLLLRKTKGGVDLLQARLGVDSTALQKVNHTAFFVSRAIYGINPRIDPLPGTGIILTSLLELIRLSSTHAD